MKCLCSFCFSNLASLFEDIIYIIKMLFPVFTSFADWRKLCLEYFVQEFLNLDITQTAACIMSFQFIQILIFRQEFREVFRFAESIQINKYRIAINISRILNTKMIRIREHGHNLLLNLICLIGKIRNGVKGGMKNG